MNLPDGRVLTVDDGVSLEPTGAGDRIIFWLPTGIEKGRRLWERVGTVAGAAASTIQGIRTVAATSVPAKQRGVGDVGGLLRRLSGRSGDHTLTLPGGGSAEPCGARRTDVVVAWSDDESDPLDEPRIRSRWPACRAVRRIGEGVFVVSGIDPSRLGEGHSTLPSPRPSRQLAEQALASARREGDRRREVTALTDLGLTLLFEGASEQATTVFEEALSGARRIGDRASEADASTNLAWAALLLNRPDWAREAVGPALAYAREVGDRYAEKVALERLGQAYRDLGDHVRALGCFDRAVTLARELRDRQHEAALLWHEAIEHAELGRPEHAAARAQESIDLLYRLDKPQADWYARHAASYGSLPNAASLAATGRPGPTPAGVHLGGAIDTSAVSTRPASPPAPAEASKGPGILRMAVSATQAMAKFVGSGFQTVAPEARHARLAVCATCEHHTGVRCRICSCITAAKARMAHEDCPAGKWPH